MPFKKLIKTVKENHHKLKEQAEKEKKSETKNKLNTANIDDVTIHESSKKGISLKDGLFVEKAQHIASAKPKTYKVEKDDTLKKIAKKVFDDEKKWIMIHLKNIHKIPNPYRLIEAMILEIPYNEDINNYYDIHSKKGNYIIQDKDDIKIIAKKIFGSDKFAKKLIEWDFLKFTKDIYPGKEIKGLKYLDLIRQTELISKKYGLKENISYSEIITELIIKISVKENMPALIPLLIADLNHHWFIIQENNENVIDENIWLPMNLDQRLYKNDFPKIAMDIEFNIIYGINKLKELRVKHKNWPKAIGAYFMDSPPGIGKPEEQKIKTKELIKILDSVLEKMNNKVLAKKIRQITDFQNKEHITFDLLYRELNDYKEFSMRKYF